MYPHLEILDFILIAIIIAGAGIGQAAVGFGYALFATPLLLKVGLPLPHAIILISSCSLYQSVFASWKLRNDIPWKITLSVLPIRFVSLLLGLYLLEKLVNLSNHIIQSAIGAVILFLVILQVICKPKPAASLHWIWTWITFISSGIIAGLAGMGGPPVVLWVMAHNWDSRKTRGFLFSIFTTSIPLQLIIMSFQFEGIIKEIISLSIFCIPFVFLGSAIGIPIGNRLEKDKLRLIACSILIIIGISSIIPVLLPS
jgi:uncharacterized protein